jgi:hypothetical protein
MDDARDIAAVLRGTALQGHPVEEGIGATFLVGEVDPARLLECWHAAHGVMARTGRWPVFSLPGELYHEPDAVELEELDRAARTLDPWTVYRRSCNAEPMERVRAEIYVETFLGFDTVVPGFEELAGPITDMRLQRWLYDLLVSHPGLLARVFTSGYDYLIGTNSWHMTSEVQLVLLPTTAQWLAPAWLPYWGASERSNGFPAWAAAMYEWDRRWGASLVATWGTMLQYVTRRRPRLGDEAWELAGQLMAVGSSLQCEQWQLAIALTRGNAWFLHDRP